MRKDRWTHRNPQSHFTTGNRETGPIFLSGEASVTVDG